MSSGPTKCTQPTGLLHGCIKLERHSLGSNPISALLFLFGEDFVRVVMVDVADHSALINLAKQVEVRAGRRTLFFLEDLV